MYDHNRKDQLPPTIPKQSKQIMPDFPPSTITNTNHPLKHPTWN